MKFFTSSILLLASLTSANPVITPSPRQTTPGPYKITNFFASKTHLSGYCSFEFQVTSPTLTAPATCTAYLDSGFSGSWWLASVWPGSGKCDNAAVDWTFYQQQMFDDTPANFSVTIDGVAGSYTIPKEDISVSVNGNSPFDDDVYYSGPRDFDIVEFGN